MMDQIVPGLYQGSQYEFHEAGIDVVVDLTGAHRATRRGLLSVEWPILDGPMPDEGKARALGIWVAELVEAGFQVAVLCAAGINRSSLITARALIAMGYPPEEAISRVRARRLGALNNAAFVQWLMGEEPPANEDE